MPGKLYDAFVDPQKLGRTSGQRGPSSSKFRLPFAKKTKVSGIADFFFTWAPAHGQLVGPPENSKYRDDLRYVVKLMIEEHAAWQILHCKSKLDFDMKKEELDTPIKIPRTTYIISNLL